MVQKLFVFELPFTFNRFRYKAFLQRKLIYYLKETIGTVLLCKKKKIPNKQDQRPQIQESTEVNKIRECANMKFTNEPSLEKAIRDGRKGGFSPDWNFRIARGISYQRTSAVICDCSSAILVK